MNNSNYERILFMKKLNLHKLGIDIGSTTVKIALLDPNNVMLFSDYERHFANIRETLSDLLKKQSSFKNSVWLKMIKFNIMF